MRTTWAASQNQPRSSGDGTVSSLGVGFDEVRKQQIAEPEELADSGAGQERLTPELQIRHLGGRIRRGEEMDRLRIRL